MLEIRATVGFSMVARLLLLWSVWTLRTSLSSVVTQSPKSISASIGDSLSLKCTRDLPIIYCYSSVSWFKVSPTTGKLKQVSNYVQDKLEDDRKSCTRTIFNARVEDSGIYYCTSIYDKMVFLGTGTIVIVTDHGPLNLSVVLYTPTEVDTPSVLLQCVVMNAVPSQISVLWVIDGDERTGWTEVGWTGQDDSASPYTRAQITIPAEEWREAARSIECVVKAGHNYTSQTLHRQSHSDSTCTWLVYGGCGVAVFTIAMSLTMAMFLRKDKRATLPVKRLRAGVDTRRKHQTQGKLNTLRTSQEKPSASSGVEYSCLNHDNFKQRPSAPPLEIAEQTL